MTMTHVKEPVSSVVIHSDFRLYFKEGFIYFYKNLKCETIFF